LRNCCPHDKEPINKKTIEEWMPVDLYIGGIEHAVLHLLYARFFTMVLNDCGYINIREPFKTLLTQGMVCHTSFQDDSGKWLYPSEVEKDSNNKYFAINGNRPVTAVRSEKMSKSKKNLVNPEQIINTYGADSLRIFIMSDTPYEKDFDWNTDALEGAWRYLNKMWRLCEQIKEKYKFFAVPVHEKNPQKETQRAEAERTQMGLSIQASDQLIEEFFADGYKSPLCEHGAIYANDSQILKNTHYYLKKINTALNQFAFHKAIAFHRELTRAIECVVCNETPIEIMAEVMNIWIRVIAPFAPHFALEAYQFLFNTPETIDFLCWPELRNELAKEDTVTIVVQVNGKLRHTFETEVNKPDDELKEIALSNENVQKFINGNIVKKVIIVSNKLVNVVTK
jgi:leucyl-tRNA synthetase